MTFQILHPGALILIGVLTGMTGRSFAAAPDAHSTSDEAEPVDVAFVSLAEPPEMDIVGPYVNALMLREAIDAIPFQQRPDLVVLELHSRGGMLSEAPYISDYIERELEPECRVVMWVDEAYSAAALVAMCADEVVMHTDGAIGAAVTFENRDGEWQAIQGDDLDRALRVGEIIASRGGHEPLVIRAMQSRTACSYDETPDGARQWRADEQGEVVVNPTDRILTLNAEQALEHGVIEGVADSREELMGVLGIDSWRIVGEQADDHIRNARRDLKRKAARLMRLLDEIDKAMDQSLETDDRLRLAQLAEVVESRLEEAESLASEIPWREILVRDCSHRLKRARDTLGYLRNESASRR